MNGKPNRSRGLGAWIIFGGGIAAWLLARGAGAGPGVAAGVLLGTLAAAFGSVSWWALMTLGLRRGQRTFLAALLGGFLFRMLLYGAVLIAAIRHGGVALPSLLVALFGSHLLYQVAEVAARHAERRPPVISPSGWSPRVALLLVLAGMPSIVPALAGTPGAETRGNPEEAVEAAQESVPEGGPAENRGEPAFDMIHHVVDGREMETPFGRFELPHGWVVGGIDLSPTRHVVWMWIAALTMVVMVRVATLRGGLVPRGLANAVEMVVVFVRDEVARKNIAHHADAFTPYLCTLFFFILFCNLAGLVPFGATATSNLNVTAALAALSLIMIQAAGIRENGLLAHLKAFCPIPTGVPGWLLPVYVPIIVVVEVVGTFAKPVALSLRLFANMTAGHIVILSLLGLIFTLKTVFVAPASVAFSMFIYFLEMFVALVQAYIFTMLTALFIGMSQHPAH